MSVFDKNGRPLMASLLLSSAVLTACEEELPVGVGDSALPAEPVTVEVEIPWSDFASNLEVFGGYGSPEDLGQGFVANGFAGTLEARTLARYRGYPQAVTVRDMTGALRPDSSITFIGGRLIAVMDAVASTNTGPVSLRLGRLDQEWDPTTATWEAAIDTINDVRAWTEPGAGPVAVLDTAVWDPAAADTVVFMLDSATVAAWADTTDLSRGARIELLDVGPRLQINATRLNLDVRPASNPDTVVQVGVSSKSTTFIYSPFPDPPPDGIRIGGAPSWRTVLDVAIPTEINGPAAFCAVVSCPHRLEPRQISFAALKLTSRMTDAAFQPTDSVRLDVRPVFDRSAMPKSPLGPSLVGATLGRAVAADAFGDDGPRAIVEVPFTTFARDLLRGVDDDGNPAPHPLVLLSVFEPLSIAFASFEGPGPLDTEPALRLVLTIGPAMELP